MVDLCCDFARFCMVDLYRGRGYNEIVELARVIMPRQEKSHARSADCACVTGPGQQAVSVDPVLKLSNQKRLRRIEGQIRSLQKMVQGDRYCADIIVQIASV